MKVRLYRKNLQKSGLALLKSENELIASMSDHIVMNNTSLNGCRERYQVLGKSQRMIINNIIESRRRANDSAPLITLK